MLLIADLFNISIYISFALLFVVSALLLLVILMQRPKQEGLGAAFGAAMTDQAFGARTTDVLKKATVLFATLFFIICLALGILLNKSYRDGKSKLTENAVPVKQAEPTKPATENISALLNQQKQNTPTPAATPATPAEQPVAPAPEAKPETPAQPAPAPNAPATQPAA